MFSYQSFEMEPIRVGFPWVQDFEFDADIFNVGHTYTGNLAQAANGDAPIVTAVTVTRQSNRILRLELSAVRTAALNNLQFKAKRGVDTASVLIDIIRTDPNPDVALDIMLELPVIRSV